MELEHLRSLVPPPAEERLAPARLADRKEILMREMVRPQAPQMPDVVAGSRPKRSRRRRNRIVAMILVPAALVGGALAYSMTANRSADQLGDFVTCYQAPKLDAPAAGTSFTGQSLAAFCETQWSSGSITAPPPGPAPTRWVACEGDQGVDVFPSEDEQSLCQRLGLQPVPPDYYEAVKRYSAMESDLFARFPDTGCIDAQDATATTRQVLEAHGYAGWRIQSDEFADLTPCALGPDLDPVNGVATIRARVRPELLAGVRQGLDQAGSCGPQELLLGDVRNALEGAGFGDWTVTIDHELTSKWPCVAGFNEDPDTKTIVLTGYSTA